MSRAAAFNLPRPTGGGLTNLCHVFLLNASCYPSPSAHVHPLLSQAREHQEQLAEARLRFVAAVKANYQDNFRKGWLSDSGLRVLMVRGFPVRGTLGGVCVGVERGSENLVFACSWYTYSIDRRFW